MLLPAEGGLAAFVDATLQHTGPACMHELQPVACRREPSLQPAICAPCFLAFLTLVGMLRSLQQADMLSTCCVPHPALQGTMTCGAATCCG